MTTTPQPAKPERHWYQFSLATLLIVTVVLASTVGWIGSRILQAIRNRAREVVAVEEVAAVREIEKMGGRVSYSYKRQRPETWLEDLFDDPGDPEDPVRISVVTEVEFWNTNITDAGLIHLKELRSLRVLSLSNAKISNTGLNHLKGLTSIEELDLTSTNVSDAGLEHLRGMTELKLLDLAFTYVTDAGLEHLAVLSNLSRLDLIGTRVTDEGMKKLKEKLPNLRVSQDRRFKVRPLP